MQICAIYKSNKKLDTYLYLANKDDFSSVDEGLLALFGQPQFVMMLPLMKVEKLAQANIEKVREALQDKGYYLQLPPPSKNLLDEYKEWKQSLKG